MKAFSTLADMLRRLERVTLRNVAEKGVSLMLDEGTEPQIFGLQKGTSANRIKNGNGRE